MRSSGRSSRRALRANRLELARALVRERIHAKPDSPYNWLQQARVSSAVGDAGGATEAERRVAELRRSGHAERSPRAAEPA